MIVFNLENIVELFEKIYFKWKVDLVTKMQEDSSKDWKEREQRFEEFRHNNDRKTSFEWRIFLYQMRILMKRRKTDEQTKIEKVWKCQWWKKTLMWSKREDWSLISCDFVRNLFKLSLWWHSFRLWWWARDWCYVLKQKSLCDLFKSRFKNYCNNHKIRFCIVDLLCNLE